VGCTGETKTDTVETTKQALVVTDQAVAPTSYATFEGYPSWHNPAGALQTGGQAASATNHTDQVIETYSGFHLTSIPNDVTIDEVRVQWNAKKSRNQNCNPQMWACTRLDGSWTSCSYLSALTTDYDTKTQTLGQPVSVGSLKNALAIGINYSNAATQPQNCNVDLDYAGIVVSYHKCDPGTWWNANARTCSACDTSCATCNGAGATACTSCGANKYLSLNPGSSAVGSCADCGSPTCAVDEYAVACGTYQPASCAKCPNCQDTDKYVSACNSDGTSVCTPITHCQAGQRVTVPFTSRSNQQCTACTDGTYNQDTIDLNLETESCYACPTGTWSDYTEGSVGPTGCYNVPVVMSLGPASGVTDGGDSVTISGSFFAPTAKVLFGGAEATSVVVSADGTHITALTPAHAIGTVDVTIDNNDGHVRRFATLDQAFTYQGAAVPLTVSGLSPASGSIAGGTTVTINGGGFVVGSTNVQFGGVAAGSVTVLSPTQLTVVTPAHAAGVVSVVVINGRGGMGTLSNSFTYTDSLPPADIDAGVDDAGTSTGTGTATSATATSTGTATSATNTGTGTATSAVATSTNTVVIVTNTGIGTATSAVATGTATSVVTTNTGTATVTSATNTGTGTATLATGTGTATKTGATSTVTNITTGVDAGVDAVVAADGGADTKITADGGTDGGAIDGPVVIPGADAATPGTDAKIATDGGAAIDAKIATDGGAGTDAATPVVKKSDDGCSCDMGSSNANQNGGVILLVLGSVLVAIRRKRTRR
jgi:hypothetical protein